MKTVLLVMVASVCIIVMFFLPIFIIYDTYFLELLREIVKNLIYKDFIFGAVSGAFAMFLIIAITEAARTKRHG